MKLRGEEEVATPLAFVHPCWKGGCTEYAAHGYGVHFTAETPKLGLWTCTTHQAELEARLNGKSTPAADTVFTPTMETEDDGERNGDSSLFDGA